MSALPQSGAAALEIVAMTVADLDRVLPVEQLAYEFPWTRGNFVDSLAAGYQARVLRPRGAPGQVAGYYLAMEGVGELHLLNLTVAPDWQRRGLALVLLDDLVAFARGRSLAQVWLEVRAANLRAQAIYRRYGFRTIGRRRGYYPAPAGRREDAIVMGLALDGLD
jgi:[ribosomal protein S18]-alanine N-acetyltransferase